MKAEAAKRQSLEKEIAALRRDLAGSEQARSESAKKSGRWRTKPAAVTRRWLARAKNWPRPPGSRRLSKRRLPRLRRTLH